jgi:hypothetical protein
MKWKLFFIFGCVELLSACQTLPGVLSPTALANTPTIQIESLTSSPTQTPTTEGDDILLNSILIPLGNPPTINGTISPDEWEQAAIESFADSSELLLMLDREFLYVGIRANGPGMIAANIFIQSGDEIFILHSSAALGTAIYQQGEDGWQQTQNFIWRCRSTSHGDAAQAERDAFLQQEGWIAANGRMGTPNELEYQIKIPVGDFRLAVVYIKASPPYEKIPWPRQLADDTVKPTPGGFPDTLYFSPEQWVEVNLSEI